ncbi:MAG: DNA repair protein RadA, partial [Planococcus sp. (in: Bacteria)]|nr:DNA repair protein RadA [Planococcus sp. (in: firmicutes)]
MAKKKTKFICQSCGYESARWMGKCPGCAAWNTMTEEVEVAAPKGTRGAFQHSASVPQKATPINAIET